MATSEFILAPTLAAAPARARPARPAGLPGPARTASGRAMVIALMSSVLLDACAAETSAPPATSGAPTILQSSWPAQPAPSDQVRLTDGTVVGGVVLNHTIRFRTVYGELSLPWGKLAGIQLDAPTGGLDQVFTTNGNRFAGLLEEPGFTLRSVRGETAEYRRERVVQVVRLAAPPPTTIASLWFRMRNGDWLSGRVLEREWTLVRESVRRQVLLADISSVRFDSTAGRVTTVVLRDGETWSGTLEPEEIAIELDVGPELRLHQDLIDRIQTAPPPPTWTPAMVLRGPTGSGMPPGPGGPTHFEGMVWVAPGRFTMGSPVEEVGRDEDEGPETSVTIARGFWLGTREVTQAEYKRVMGSNPSNFAGDPLLPVERVTWLEAMEFCSRMTRLAAQRGELPDGWAFRLPTEAEWEYACRAGTTNRFWYGEDRHLSQLGEYAWFGGNSDSTTHPVGQKPANPWGLFDMHGNVWEWCLNRFEGGLPGGVITNVAMPAEGSLRVARGGSWLYDGRACRSANRDDYSPANRCSDVGFRIVLAPLEP